jgi:VanZ family protein
MTAVPPAHDVPNSTRARVAARVLLVSYLVLVLVIVAWPTPVDRPIDSGLDGWLSRRHAAGLPAFVNYASIEASANVLMFVPLAALLALSLRRGRLWLAPVSCVALSIAIELFQYFALPGRFGTVQDVVCDSIGALIGTLIVLVARSARRPRRTAAF